MNIEISKYLSGTYAMLLIIFCVFKVGGKHFILVRQVLTYVPARNYVKFNLWVD